VTVEEEAAAEEGVGSSAEEVAAGGGSRLRGRWEERREEGILWFGGRSTRFICRRVAGPFGLMGLVPAQWAASCRPISCRAGPARWAEIATNTARRWARAGPSPKKSCWARARVEPKNRAELVIVLGQKIVLRSGPWASCHLAIYTSPNLRFFSPPAALVLLCSSLCAHKPAAATTTSDQQSRRLRVRSSKPSPPGLSKPGTSRTRPPRAALRLGRSSPRPLSKVMLQLPPSSSPICRRGSRPGRLLVAGTARRDCLFFCACSLLTRGAQAAA
jgi:hypothetical protein